MFKINTIKFNIMVALLVMPFANYAQTKVVVIPLGGDDVVQVQTPTSKTIFFTDSVYNGNLGGLSGADDKCQTAANNANPALEGRFKAWISTSITPAVQLRESFAQYDLPYHNVDDSLVANNFEDFLDGVFTGIIKSASGQTNPTSNGGINFGIWTGTSDTGNPSASNCSDWTDSSSQSFGTIGVAHGGTGAGGRWSNAGFDYGCSNVARLYCFEQ